MRNNHNNHKNQPTGYENWSHEALLARKRELEARLREYYPMLATETDEDAHIEGLLQEVKERTKSATPTQEDAQPVDGSELLQEVTQFLARYLQCSEHQRTLLALWVLHTYCFCAARVTPYLAIRSADKQSGKTLCLQLLSLLCDRAALTSGGFTPRDLALPMKEKRIAALLFDECHLTLGTRPHPRSPALRAVLAGSFHLGLGHRNIAEERNAFLPKAFAGRGPLPEELADRCIPIILEPLDTRVAQPSEPQQKQEWTAAALGCVLRTPPPENAQKKETVGAAVTQARPAVSAPPSKPARNAAGRSAVADDTTSPDRALEPRPAPAGRGSEANQQTQRFSQKPRAKSRPVPARRGRPRLAVGQELLSRGTKNSAASTDEPTRPAVTPQQPRPNEILPGITCGDVFDDRWLHAFRR